MARAHTPPLSIHDDLGNLVTGASVRVLKPGTTIPVAAALYASRSGGSVKAQPWISDDGLIDFYLNSPQTVRLGVTWSGVEKFIEDVDVGAVVGWATTVRDFGAVGDGVTDDSAAIQSAIDAMPVGGSLYFPTGTYVIGTTIQLPRVDGASLIGPPASPVRRSGATLLAKSSASLTAIAASPEWLNSGLPGGVKDAQGVVISGLTFDGGGFSANSVHDTTIETTAHTLYGLVIHGTGFKIKDVFINSANSHGLLVAGSVGADGATTISETHEGWIMDCGIRYVGGDGFHAAPGAQDCFMSTTKVQYAGGHGFFIDDSCSAWHFDANHPSRCGRDMFHCESGWECGLTNNYIDSLGNFMDGVSIPGRAAGDTRYGIYMKTASGNCAHVDHNRMHTDTSGGQSDPVVGLYLRGWVMATYNSLIYQATDSSVTMTVDGGTAAWSQVVGNVAHTAS